MEPFITFERILENIQIESFYNIEITQPIQNINTDTRTLASGDVFVALRGSNFDGHNFIHDAIKKGARFFVVESKWFKKDNNKHLPLVVVKDTLYFLGELANLYRQFFEIPFIAVAGSNGKTTTKDFIAHILGQKYNVLKTEGNYNNLIGVPLTLLRLRKEHQIGVLEIGTNQPGEIARLCEIIEPTDGVITNIGKEHLEFFYDLDGVEMEETTLFGYLLKHNGFSFVNVDDSRLIRYVKILENKLTYGQSETANLQAKIKLNPDLTTEINYIWEDNEINAKLFNPGLSVAYASIPAVAIGFKFGLNTTEIIKGLETFRLQDTNSYGRMLIKNINNVLIINDTYNANPSSLKLAIETLRMLETNSPKFAILGDMLELGISSKIEHIAILNLAKNVCEKVFIFGEEMKKAFDELPDRSNILWFQNKMDIVQQLIDYVFPGAVLLFKASRGMKCEDILSSFIDKFQK